MGILVPLYVQPGTLWTQIVNTKKSNPSVDIGVILNSNSGPGTAYNSTYDNGIAAFKAVGVKMFGYVWCGDVNEFDGRNCINDIPNWKSWYPSVTSLFVDGYMGGYAYTGSNQVQRARAAGYSPVIGNPGGAVAASKLTAVDVACVYEGAGLPPLSKMQQLATTYGAERVYLLPYGVSALDTNWLKQAKNYCQWLYVTNDVLPNPWDSLPSYFNALVSAMADVVVTPTTPPVFDQVAYDKGFADGKASINQESIYQNGYNAGVISGIAQQKKLASDFLAQLINEINKFLS